MNNGNNKSKTKWKSLVDWHSQSIDPSANIVWLFICVCFFARTLFFTCRQWLLTWWKWLCSHLQHLSSSFIHSPLSSLSVSLFHSISYWFTGWWASSRKSHMNEVNKWMCYVIFITTLHTIYSMRHSFDTNNWDYIVTVNLPDCLKWECESNDVFPMPTFAFVNVFVE